MPSQPSALPSTRFASSVNHMHFARTIIASLIALALIVSPGMKAWAFHSASAGSQTHCIGDDGVYSKSGEKTAVETGLHKQGETDPPLMPADADKDECCGPLCAAADADELGGFLPSLQTSDLARQTLEHLLSGQVLAIEPPPPRSLQS